MDEKKETRTMEGERRERDSEKYDHPIGVLIGTGREWVSVRMCARARGHRHTEIIETNWLSVRSPCSMTPSSACFSILSLFFPLQ